MKLWHTIPTARLSQLQEQAMAFLISREVDFGVQQIFYFDLKKIRGQSALKQELEELDLFQHIISVAVHVLPPGREQFIHVDSITAHKYSYNIPILNCSDSRVVYYSSSRPAIPVLDYHHSTRPGNHRPVTYQQYDPAYCTEIGSFSMTEPTIICTAEPHRVEHPSDQLRLALLCRIGLKADLTGFGLDNRLAQ